MQSLTEVVNSFAGVVRVLDDADIVRLWHIMQDTNKTIDAYHVACLMKTVHELRRTREEL